MAGARKAVNARASSEYMYIDSCRADRWYPVRTAIIPYSPKSLLIKSERVIRLAPVCSGKT